MKHGKHIWIAITPRGSDMAHSFPEVIACLHDLPNLVIGGELVVLNDMRAPQFERVRWRALMSRHKEVIHAAQKEPAAIFAFHLLMLDGLDLRKRPLIERKAALQPVLVRCPRIQFANLIQEEREAFFEQVSKLALEGVVCKRPNSAYVDGPPRHWPKIKTAAGNCVEMSA
jgi:bifunctional non-homologous end joining protein LigD